MKGISTALARDAVTAAPQGCKRSRDALDTVSSHHTCELHRHVQRTIYERAICCMRTWRRPRKRAACPRTRAACKFVRPPSRSAPNQVLSSDEPGEAPTLSVEFPRVRDGIPSPAMSGYGFAEPAPVHRPCGTARAERPTRHPRRSVSLLERSHDGKVSPFYKDHQ